MYLIAFCVTIYSTLLWSFSVTLLFSFLSCYKLFALHWLSFVLSIPFWLLSTRFTISEAVASDFIGIYCFSTCYLIYGGDGEGEAEMVTLANENDCSEFSLEAMHSFYWFCYFYYCFSSVCLFLSRTYWLINSLVVFFLLLLLLVLLCFIYFCFTLFYLFTFTRLHLSDVRSDLGGVVHIVCSKCAELFSIYLSVLILLSLWFWFAWASLYCVCRDEVRYGMMCNWL